MPQISQTPQNTLWDDEELEQIKEHLQIFANGFSADYKNKIQLLYLRLGGKYNPMKDFILPTYEQYIEEKISIFQPYNPDISIKDILYSGVTEDALRDFNMRVSEINDLVRMWESEAVVKIRCEDLIREFLEEKIRLIMEDTLVALGKAF